MRAFKAVGGTPRFGRTNFPSRHPLNQSQRGAAAVGDADVIVGLEVADFWQAVSTHARMNLHVLLHYGRNSHHISEAIFKGLAIAAATAALCGPLREKLAGRRVALVVCGANIDPATFTRHLTDAPAE